MSETKSNADRVNAGLKFVCKLCPRGCSPTRHFFYHNTQRWTCDECGEEHEPVVDIQPGE